jgi:purine nucleosidase
VLRRDAIAFVAMIAAAFACSRQPTAVDVLIDQDGAIDDLIAVALLLRSPEVRVHAIALTPGDSFLEPATRATQLIVDSLGGSNIVIGQGHSEGRNPFPDAWRKDAGRVLDIPALIGAKPEASTAVASDDAPHLLARLLSQRRYVILETGPLTNIAAALRLNPTIANNIERIYAMGGAVRVGGNVEQPGHDGSAEWNMFNEPDAAAHVLQAGIPLTLVPLDATNQVPLTHSFLERLRAQSSVASQMAAQAWSLVVSQTGNEKYFFWDTLTAAAILDPRVITTERLKIRVVTTGESQGRTVEEADGVPVDVALRADQQRVERMFLDVLAR